MSSRRKGRELAVQMLYQWDIGRQPADEVLESFRQLAPRSGRSMDFARRLLEGTLAHLEEVDTLIAGHAEHWRVERMVTVDRNILRLAIYEFLHEDTPKKVVINEALEIAKRFSTPEAVQFINGILDTVRQRIATAREVD